MFYGGGPASSGRRWTTVRAGSGSDVAGADWWTGPASWRVGVAPVSRAAIRYSLAEGARESPPSLPKL